MVDPVEIVFFKWGIEVVGCFREWWRYSVVVLVWHVSFLGVEREANESVRVWQRERVESTWEIEKRSFASRHLT